MKRNNYNFTVADIFQAGMVLQREKDIKIWGIAPAGSRVSATLGENKASSLADDDWTYLVSLSPMEAAENLILKVECDAPNTIPYEFHSISIGDIWLACGQSNMEFFLRYDQDWETVQKLPFNPKIHMYNVPQVAFEGHTSHNKGGYGYWMQEGDNGFDMFSAPGYSFARDLQPTIDVPIGIIGCNWGGSTASAWVPEEVLDREPLNNYFKEYELLKPDISDEEMRMQSLSAWKFEDTSSSYKDFEPLLYGRSRAWQLEFMERTSGAPQIPMGPYNLNRPCGLYHTMLSTIIPFSIKGVLWYQGESDSGDRAWMYDQLLTALIEDWRKEWGDSFPFLLVQLAPFSKWLACGNEEYRLIRQQQQKVADTVPDTHMASIMDIGSYYDIHPKEKMEVGRRLSLLARGHVYGEKNLLCDPPRFQSAQIISEGLVEITLKNAKGLKLTDQGSDFVCTSGSISLPPTKVEIKDDKILLSLSDKILSQKEPITISLGWDDFAQIFIHNEQGLCVSPFITTLK